MTEKRPQKWATCKTHNLRFDASKGGCIACYRARKAWYEAAGKELPDAASE